MSAALVDRIVNYFDPKAGISRQKARLALAQLEKIYERHYEGASHTRRAEGWNPRSSNADAEIKLAGRSLRDRTRYLCRNNPYAKKAKRVIGNCVVGSGIRLQIKGPDRLVKRVLPIWKDWAETPAIDYYSRHNWYELQRVIMNGWIESGEMLCRVYKRRNQESVGISRDGA